MSFPDYPDALAREQKLSFVICGLLGLDESARWVRDPELTRRVGSALGRAMDLLQQIRVETEGAIKRARHAG